MVVVLGFSFLSVLPDDVAELFPSCIFPGAEPCFSNQIFSEFSEKPQTNEKKRKFSEHYTLLDACADGKLWLVMGVFQSPSCRIRHHPALQLYSCVIFFLMECQG